MIDLRVSPAHAVSQCSGFLNKLQAFCVVERSLTSGLQGLGRNGGRVNVGLRLCKVHC